MLFRSFQHPRRSSNRLSSWCPESAPSCSPPGPPVSLSARPIRYFLYLHFKFYSLSSFPFRKPPYIILPLPLLTNPPTPASLPWHSPTLGHRAFTRPRASPPINDLQGYPLLYMQLKPWVAPCVLFGWWFSPWELMGYWLVHIVEIGRAHV